MRPVALVWPDRAHHSDSDPREECKDYLVLVTGAAMGAPSPVAPGEALAARA